MCLMYFLKSQITFLVKYKFSTKSFDSAYYSEHSFF